MRSVEWIHTSRIYIYISTADPCQQTREVRAQLCQLLSLQYTETADPCQQTRDVRAQLC